MQALELLTRNGLGRWRTFESFYSDLGNGYPTAFIMAQNGDQPRAGRTDPRRAIVIPSGNPQKPAARPPEYQKRRSAFDHAPIGQRFDPWHKDTATRR
jgi:hypothetical protein